MAQVICKSKAGQLAPQLGGIRFFRSAVGHISVEISEDKANEFLEMPDHFVMHMGDPIEAPKKGAKPERAPRPDPTGANTPPPAGTSSTGAPIGDPNF